MLPTEAVTMQLDGLFPLTPALSLRRGSAFGSLACSSPLDAFAEFEPNGGGAGWDTRGACGPRLKSALSPLMFMWRFDDLDLNRF